MKLTVLRKTSLFLAALFISFSSVAQKKMASPRDSSAAKIGKSNVSINYGSPAVKGRVIWGDLVPYKKVWRAGANEATRFTTTEAISVEGKNLPAGTYGLFIIPSENEWIIIFNKTAKQWGAYEYKEKDDVLRVTVKPVKSAKMAENLKYTFTSKGLLISWENLEVPVSMK
jgi:hypothetical protein